MGIQGPSHQLLQCHPPPALPVQRIAPGYVGHGVCVLKPREEQANMFRTLTWLVAETRSRGHKMGCSLAVVTPYALLVTILVSLPRQRFNEDIIQGPRENEHTRIQIAGVCTTCRHFGSHSLDSRRQRCLLLPRIGAKSAALGQHNRTRWRRATESVHIYLLFEP
ncbi:hypothetical protein EDD18DRAFT_395530 [Armillaria luteobubalina]|uniref:Uncharacterized protein n=1 Tax=Armillaria luteobubalina TaxID=153913 RepID=A0AA39Q2Z7_9AGAR|nr:hypothetical protein EDD18DRAFT_395530 [Armillaria luteobubalina]